MYNAVELVIMVFLTFKRFQGVYFWSLLLSSFGIIPYALGFLLKFMEITTGNLRWLAIFFLTIGWYPMITGQALVLWSRLHLIVNGSRGDRIIRYTMWMIIIDAICLHIPTTVLTFGSNGRTNLQVFEFGYVICNVVIRYGIDAYVFRYNIMEKIQMCGFFCQEVILSSIYILETSKILRSSLQPNTRKTMQQLLLINAVIIVMDLALLALEAKSLYILETLFKGVIYSIKLKLEFAILGKLVKFVGGNQASANARNASVGFVGTNTDKGGAIDQDMDINEFVDLGRVHTDHTHPSRPSESLASRRKNTRAQGMDYEFDFARFEHAETSTVLPDPDLDPMEHIEDIGDIRESLSSASSPREPNGHV